MTLTNQRGEQLNIEKEVLVSDAFSANHYDTEVTCCMTQLSDILKKAGNTIFTVEFTKKMEEKDILAELNKLYPSGAKTTGLTLEDMMKSLDRQIIGYLVKNETHFGRSLICDLEKSKPDKKAFAQVDHRTIQSIILRNVKYTLGKTSTLATL